MMISDPQTYNRTYSVASMYKNNNFKSVYWLLSDDFIWNLWQIKVTDGVSIININIYLSLSRLQVRQLVVLTAG